MIALSNDVSQPLFLPLLFSIRITVSSIWRCAPMLHWETLEKNKKQTHVKLSRKERGGGMDCNCNCNYTLRRQLSARGKAYQGRRETHGNYVHANKIVEHKQQTRMAIKDFFFISRKKWGKIELEIEFRHGKSQTTHTKNDCNRLLERFNYTRSLSFTLPEMLRLTFSSRPIRPSSYKYHGPIVCWF